MTKREQQRDRDGLGATRLDLGDRLPQRFVGERRHHTSGTVPLHDADDVVARDQGRRMILGQIVEGGPILAPQPQQILESGGGHQHRPGAATF